MNVDTGLKYLAGASGVGVVICILLVFLTDLPVKDVMIATAVLVLINQLSWGFALFVRNEKSKDDGFKIPSAAAPALAPPQM